MEEKTILLVEDNPDDEQLTLRALKKNSLPNRVIVAHDGVEALDYLLGEKSDRTRQPELVLMDLNLPRINGLEVLKQIRANESTRNLPVVILTSSDEEKDIVTSYNFGANSYIRKPVNFEQFIEAVRQLKLYWLVLNVKAP